MRKLVLESLAKRFQSYDDLTASLEDAQLGEKVDVPKHKSLLEHLWCIVGARESYARAIDKGEWSGFSCSMAEYTHDEIAAKLRSSAEAVLAAANDVANWTEEHERLLLELSDHEVMHEGGIIRHMYAFELDIPESVKWA